MGAQGEPGAVPSPPSRRSESVREARSATDSVPENRAARRGPPSESPEVERDVLIL
ncbi:MAG TPA: hypothetical protein VMI55_03410 [Thermoplasmata archaeon]|nr:hypothetical protein [Thermoplasmata archaeon]